MKSAHKKFNVKAVMIDLDGTLIDTAPEIARAANAMLLALGKPTLAAAQIESYIGEGAVRLVKRCLTGERLGEPEEALLNDAEALFFEHYALVATESQPYPQVAENLLAIKNAGYPLACVTNKPASFTVPLLQAADLLQYFELVVSGDSLPKKKPAPDQIFYICEKLGVDVWESLLIGDSNTDILAAKNAGCYVFAVPYGYNQGLAIDQNAVDLMVNGLDEVLMHI